uniref:Uncharacterized protein n=1 Tax=Monopterus albus TaxID=43700 RepID=A0A3Q3K406_MONAL
MVICTGLVLILCTVLTPALCRDCLSHYGHYSNISLTLIHNMGGPMTQEDGPVPFPEKLYRHIRKAEVETQLIFIRDSLMEIASLYRHGNWSSVTWDAIKTTGFLSSIHRQIDELNKCVSEHTLQLFTLDSTGGSTACWEWLRKQTQLHLDQLDLLVNSLRAAARRRSAPTPHQH